MKQHENEVFQFTFNGLALRAVKIDGAPWFAAADVREFLQPGDTGSSKNIIASLPSSEVCKLMKSNIGSSNVAFPNRGLNMVSEQGLYAIIMRAQRKRPEVREFQDWVTRDVLPAIRKDGGYVMGEEKVATGGMSEDELVLKALTMLQTKVERLRSENAKLSKELTSVTIAEYAALNHVYFTQSEKGRIAAAMRKLCATLGVAIEKDPRFVRVNGQELETQVNVYRRDLLDRVCGDLGVFEDARGTIRPVEGRVH